MAWPVYSTRFLHMYDQAGTLGYTVPAAKRAVLKDILLTNYAGTTAVAQVFIGPRLVVDHPFLAAEHVWQLSCMVPVYAGEVVVVYLSAVKIGAIVSGYLFDEAQLLRREGDVAFAPGHPEDPDFEAPWLPPASPRST